MRVHCVTREDERVCSPMLNNVPFSPDCLCYKPSLPFRFAISCIRQHELELTDKLARNVHSYTVIH